MRLRLIGQMEAWKLTGESVLPIGRKTRALLAILAMSAPRPVMRSRLAELLWSRRPDEQARASLRQEIHRLLNTLDSVGPDVLIVNRDYLTLRSGAVWVDVDEVLRATPARPAPLSLLDGTLLEDLDGLDPAFDSWLATEREQLRDKARELAEAMLRDQTEPDAAIRVAHQVLAIDRTHEGAWRSLIRAHAARGERGMAIQAYDRCRAVLFDRLHALPSADTERLIATVRAASGVVTTTASESSLRADGRRHARAEALIDDDPDAPSRVGEHHAAMQRGGLRVGVMPPQVLGGSETARTISIGLANELAAALARFRGISVVAPSALAQFADGPRDDGAIRRTFDLHFLLDGSVQHVGARIRIGLRLLDLRASNQIVWSRRFDRTEAESFSVDDEVAAEASAQIDHELHRIEAHRGQHRPHAETTAQDMLLRALPMMNRLERQRFAQCGDLLDSIGARHPEFAPAHGWFAFWHLLLLCQNWAADRREAAVAATRLSEQALLLDPSDARMLAIAGHVRLKLHGGVDAAAALQDRALSLNPNLPLPWGLSAAALTCRGDLAEAERRLQRYRTLLPLDPQSFMFDTWGCVIALLRGDHETAASIGRAIAGSTPYLPVYKPYLAALGHLGQRDEADAVRQGLLELEPNFTLRRYAAEAPFALPEHRSAFLAGLRAAGAPEG